MASKYHSQLRYEIANDRKSLDGVMSRAEKASGEDLELRADLAKYSCMRLTGFLEQAVLSIGIDIVRRKSAGVPQSFAFSHLDKSFNPRADAVLKYVGRFSAVWRTELESFLQADEWHQSLNSLVGIRNDIAHGKSQSISIERVKQYRAIVDLIVDFLLERFAPDV